MPRRPGDTTPDPPGGRAAERLREFLDERFPGGQPMPAGADDEPAEDSCDEGQEKAQKKADKDPTAKHEPPHPGDHTTR